MPEFPSPADSFVATVMPALDLVHNLARRLARRSTDAEDLAQDTLTRAWEAWHRGVRPESVNPWLSTICLNLARDRGRRAARHPEVAWPEDLDRADSVDVEAAAITRVQRSLVDRALWTLPEPQRIAIVLMDICGLTAAEAAVITESPRGTVLARVHRGRKALGVAVHDGARGRRVSDQSADFPPPSPPPPPGQRRHTDRPVADDAKPCMDPRDETGGPQR